MVTLPKMRDSYKKILTYSFVLSTGVVFSRFFILFYRIIVARELSLSDYGLLALIISFQTTLEVLSHIQVYSSMNYYSSKLRHADKNNLSALYYTGLICTLPTFFLASLAFLIILNNYGILDFKMGLISVVMFLSYNIIHHNKGFLVGLMKFRVVSFLNISVGLSRLSLVFFLFYVIGTISIETALYAYFLSLILPVFPCLFFSLRCVDVKPRIDFNIIRKIYSYSFFSLSSILSNTLILLALKFFISLREMDSVALFDMALLSIVPADILLMNIPIVMTPLISKKHQENKKYPKIPNLFLASAMLVFIFIMFFVYTTNIDSFLVRLIVGEKYMGTLPLIRILLFCIPFKAYHLTLGGVFQGLGRVNILAAIDISFLAISIPIFYILSFNLAYLAYALVSVFAFRALVTYFAYNIVRNRSFM